MEAGGPHAQKTQYDHNEMCMSKNQDHIKIKKINFCNLQSDNFCIGHV